MVIRFYLKSLTSPVYFMEQHPMPFKTLNPPHLGQNHKGWNSVWKQILLFFERCLGAFALVPPLAHRCLHLTLLFSCICPVHHLYLLVVWTQCKHFFTLNQVRYHNISFKRTNQSDCSLKILLPSTLCINLSRYYQAEKSIISPMLYMYMTCLLSEYR